jgi:hypothetical protein
LYENQGKLDAAGAMYSRALAGYEQALRLSVDDPVLALNTVVPFLVTFDIGTVQHVFPGSRMHISHLGQSR